MEFIQKRKLINSICKGNETKVLKILGNNKDLINTVDNVIKIIK